MDILNETELKMKKALEALDNKLLNVRAGRANPAMLNGIMVPYYGVPTPINTLANITVPEARQLFVKPFDRSCVKDIERAINEANIGITPTNNGEMVILTVPELTEEKRRDYVRHSVKREEFPEDEEKLYYDEIQELIEKYNKLVDDKIKDKENELMAI